MSSSNAIGDFDLNLIKIRKSIQFPDLTIQSTAYTGAGGVPNLDEVLASGTGANNQSITDLNSITFNDLSVQNTAYTGAGGVPSLSEVLTFSNGANNQGITELNSIQFNDFSVQTTAAPICGLVKYFESNVAIPIPNSSVVPPASIALFTETLVKKGQYLINLSILIQLTGSVSNLVVREYVEAPSGLSTNVVFNYQYPNTLAVYPEIGVDSIVLSATIPITTTATNVEATLELEAFWTGAGLLGTLNTQAMITFVGFAE